jgi:2-methylcitrate dehydratase PrpD
LSLPVAKLGRLIEKLTGVQATVIYPAALAVAQDVGATGQEFITACVVGYEVGCRVGEFLGKSHYEVWSSAAHPWRKLAK